MRQILYTCVLLSGILAAPIASGQSTISDRPWEVSNSKGIWVPLLPAYELGTNANGAPAFRDNLDDVGYFSELKAVRRFLGTRTSFETKGFFAYTESLNRTEPIDVSVPNPSTGTPVPYSGDPTRLRSRIYHYGVDVALRDTWRTRFGGLSGGVAFSYMGLDQKFDVDYGANQLLREKLDTDFRGGKAIFGWDGCCHGRPSMIDLGFGFYDMDANYSFLEQLMTGTRELEFSKTTYTVETTFTTRSLYRGYQLGLVFGVKYFSHLPQIQHNDGGPATIDTDDAVMLTGLIELLL